MNAAGWATLARDIADVILILFAAALIIVAILGVAIGIHAATFGAARAVWRGLDRWAERGLARTRPEPDRLEQLINGELRAEAERIVPAAPITADELGALIRQAEECNDPPCSPEDGWVCGWHLYHVRNAAGLPGRHRLGNTPLDDQPGHVITEVAADVRRRQP